MLFVPEKLIPWFKSIALAIVRRATRCDDSGYSLMFGS